jgi:hypothetical protein
MSPDYRFDTPNGPVKLSQLFGEKRDLFVIHNMGTAATAATMWADGFNGFYPHISDRAVLRGHQPGCAGGAGGICSLARLGVSDGEHEGQRSFSADMGFANATGRPMPGVSAFQKQDGTGHARVCFAGFDDAASSARRGGCSIFCPKGVDGWRPQRNYETERPIRPARNRPALRRGVRACRSRAGRLRWAGRACRSRCSRR